MAKFSWMGVVLLLICVSAEAQQQKSVGDKKKEAVQAKEEVSVVQNRPEENALQSGKPIVAELGVRKLSSPLDVPGASAVPGDFLLQNKHISVVINAAAHTSGNALTGGYIVDAFANARPVDALGQLHLYHNNTYPRMARFKTVEAVKGTAGESAAVVARGVDSQDPTLEVVTTYTLRSHSHFVELETAIIPRKTPVEDFILGDAFAWGQAQQFVPGRGFGISGGTITVPWIGGAARGVAYGLFTEQGNLWGPLGANWADPNGTTVTLAVNEAGTYKRYFAVGEDLEQISRAYQEKNGIPVVEISGKVTEAESGIPAEGIKVNVLSEGKAVTQAMTRGGTFSIGVPPGEYALSTSDNVRSSLTSEIVVQVSADKASEPVMFQVASPATVSFDIRDRDTDANIPCKVRFIGEEDTPDPDLGPTHEIRSKNVVYLKQGKESVLVPGGNYTVVVARGVDYNMTSIPLVLKRNSTTPVSVKLERAFDRGEYLSGDFHQHMKNSFDSAVPLEDRVISSAGEGLDVAVATDHNFVTDLSPIVKRLGLEKWITTIVGCEITTRKNFFGHFNGFPLTAEMGKPGNGAIPYEKVTAAQIFAAIEAAPGDQVKQVNHPRSGDIGYFNQAYLSKEDGSTTHLNWSDRFTAIEVFNGKHIDEFPDHARDWFNLLNIGYRFTATGNSDTHRIYDHEPGYPRNYFRARKPVTGASLVKAVNDERDLFVTNGPFISFQLRGGKGIGSQQTVKEGPVAFTATIRGANFVMPNKLELFGNGESVKSVAIEETTASVKWEGTLQDEPTTDTWYVLVVSGTRSMAPAVNGLKEGDTSIEPVPLAFTNPIWIDRDGDGKFTAKNAHLFKSMNEDRSAAALEKIDELTSQSQQRGRF